MSSVPTAGASSPARRNSRSTPNAAGAGLLELAAQRLRAALAPCAVAEAELRGGVAVALGAARGHDRARPGLDDGDRHERALGRVDLRHAELAADQAVERASPWLTGA